MPIPCMRDNAAGLAVFQATADQRFALGEQVFLRTHLPTHFWVREHGKQTTWTEGRLLDTLCHPAVGLRGNRVFLLFGAAGSGKSEVMRWLLIQLQQRMPERSRFCLRIARTELDPVRIVDRVLKDFGSPGLGEDLLRRWDELRRKPVALANQLVWQALGGMYDSDEEILPLAYRLRPVVEGNLRASLAGMESRSESRNPHPLQLLTVEQLEQVMGDTVLDLQPAYEHLRARLQEGFEQMALGTVRLVPTLRSISRWIRKHHGIRPVLLVDDLVQSMNVYASDLLDYLMTLEEGEWDVVLGLTPAAFEWDRRGRDLLLRIRELDTVDDRVTKLDLSDTGGDVSSFLNEDNAPAYLAPYLDMYKQTVGYQCSAACPHFSDCVGFQWGQGEEARLTPFNPAFIRRIWRHLPSGKGRARYLLLTVRDLLQNMMEQKNGALEGLARQVERDLYVNHPDAKVRALWECYHPIANESEQDTCRPVVTSFPAEAPQALLKAWQVTLNGPVETRPLGGTTLSQTDVVTQANSPDERLPGNSIEAVGDPRAVSNPSGNTHRGTQEVDPVRAAVRDWLEGREPNRELLVPLRQGAARLLRDLVQPTLLAGVGHAQPHGSLRWSAVQDGVHLPLPVEGIDSYAGICLNRTLGSAALDLVAYGEAKGAGRTQLLNRLLQEPAVMDLLWRAEHQREQWQEQMATALGYPIDQWVFHLYRAVLVLGGDTHPPLTLSTEALLSVSPVEWPDSLVQAVRRLWEDCFRLREHLYDGERLQRYLHRWPEVRHSLAALERVSPDTLPVVVRVEDWKVGEMMRAVQEHLVRIRRWVQKGGQQWPNRHLVLDAVVRLMDGRRRGTLERRCREITESAVGPLVLPTLPPRPSVEERERVTSLLPVVKQQVPPDKAPSTHPEDGWFTGYQANAAWVALNEVAWFRSVARWCEQLTDACQILGRETASADHKSPVSGIGILDLLAGINALVTQSKEKLEVQEQRDRLRQALMSPWGCQYETALRLLVELLPASFGVSEGKAKQRGQLRAELLAWQAAKDRLVGDQCEVRNSQEHVPTAVLPTPMHLLSLLALVREACRWWRTYFKQRSLVTDRYKPLDTDTSGVGMFLAAAEKLTWPSETAVREWQNFVLQARRKGQTEFPARLLVGRRDLPESVRLWLARLLRRENDGEMLARLTPDLLAELHTHIPEWLSLMRIDLEG